MKRLVSLLLHDVYRRVASESGFSGPAADRYKLALAEFELQLATLAHTLNGRAAPGAPSSWVERASVLVAITVDDGGVSYYTTVAERLEELGWRGHCLVTTGCIGQPGFLDAPQIRELHRRGHVIGTHSVSHPTRFAACTWEQMLREWRDSRQALQDILGDDVTVGSVPGGFFSRRVALAADAAGLAVLFTSEPKTQVERVGRCDVIGRFTVRPGCRADFSSELVSLRRPALFREWAAWNSKKVLKRVLGPGYSRLADRIIGANGNRQVPSERTSDRLIRR